MFDRIYEAEARANKLEKALKDIKKEELNALLEDFNKKIDEARDSMEKVIYFLEETVGFDLAEEDPRELYSDFNWVQPFQDDYIRKVLEERSIIL